MARPKHPVTKRIEEAIDLIEKHDGEITPAAVKINAEKEITWADWTPEQASSEALDARVARVLRDRGYVITDTTTRVRKDFWHAGVEEIKAQIEVKEDSNDFDQKRLKADKAVVVFLEEKQRELGYEVYPGLFHGEIDRIYSMHSVKPPANGVAA